MSDKDKHALRNWWAFFVLGSMNNFAFVVVGSAAESLADSFDAETLLPVITWANVALGFVARGVNTVYLEGTSFWWRVIAAGILALLGLVGVSMSHVVGSFGFCIGAIVLIGGASSLGESVLLSYCRFFDSEIVGAWSSGTGMAGIAASLYYAVIHSAGIPDFTVFLITMSVIPVYWGAFACLKLPGDRRTSVVYEKVAVDDATNWDPSAEERYSVAESERSIDEEVTLLGDRVAPEGKWARYKRCLGLAWFRALMLFLSYVFEYIASSEAAHKANMDCKFFTSAGIDTCQAESLCQWNVDHCSFRTTDLDATQWSQTQAFTILAFCYQAGVFLSRSSLKFIKIRRLGLLILALFAGLLLWIFQDLFRFMIIWVQFPVMVVVGLLGGAAYVNVFYLILNDDTIASADKDVIINMSTIFQTSGITVAALLSLLFANTFLKDIA